MGAIQRPTQSLPWSPPEGTKLCGLARPQRNRYFYGKLLDAYHFELETDYMNAKRHLLNRLVTGYGVVCGLDVNATDDGEAVVVSPGFAVDPWGREIVVDCESRRVEIPGELAEKPDDGESHENCCYECREQEVDEHWVHLVLCYHECKSEPAPVLAGECGKAEPCQAGTIVERYCLEFRPGCVRGFREEACIPDFIIKNKLDYRALAKWVSAECPACLEDPCIPLANVHLEVDDAGPCCRPGEIDIAVRPIVWTNDLLFELLWSLMTEKPAARRRK